MTVFRNAAHLASWTGVCPGNNESAGKRGSGRTRKGFSSRPGGSCRERIAQKGQLSQSIGSSSRCGPKRAAVAIAHKILTAFHMATGASYRDLGDSFLDNLDASRTVNHLKRRAVPTPPCLLARSHGRAVPTPPCLHASERRSCRCRFHSALNSQSARTSRRPGESTSTSATLCKTQRRSFREPLHRIFRRRAASARIGCWLVDYFRVRTMSAQAGSALCNACTVCVVVIAHCTKATWSCEARPTRVRQAAQKHAESRLLRTSRGAQHRPCRHRCANVKHSARLPLIEETERVC